MGAAAARARVCVEMWRGESIYNLAFKKIFYRFRPLCFDDKRIQEKCCAPAKGGRHSTASRRGSRQLEFLGRRRARPHACLCAAQPSQVAT